jgi:hypothetical protein
VLGYLILKLRLEQDAKKSRRVKARKYEDKSLLGYRAV